MAVMAVAQEKEISELLSLENIYEKIKNERDFFMFECTEKNGKLFLAMTVIPAIWENGRLTQYLLVSQNIGEKHKMADLDYFKPVNDTYGHQAGDEVLRNVGKRILNSIRNDDYVFRLGGDEFACIIGGNPDEKNCLKSIERLEKNICSPYNIHGHKIKIGVSCGYAVYPSDGDTVERMLKIADSRMYSEKEKHHSGHPDNEY